jgi:hypothetical protein
MQRFEQAMKMLLGSERLTERFARHGIGQYPGSAESDTYDLQYDY